MIRLSDRPTVSMRATVLLSCLLWLSGCDPSGTSQTESDPVLDPDRDRVSGSAFIQETASATPERRQERAVAEILGGNVPVSVRERHPVRLDLGGGRSVTIHVTGDYLSVGSDSDFVRMPLTLPSARQIAREWGMYLPTTAMVDAIYEQADLRLDPQPMTPGPEMSSNAYYLAHQQMIETQRAGRAPGGLIAGHKKDIVATVRLDSQPGRIAIYGWHTAVGEPIQPLSLVHHDRYEDYSHGLRLIHPVAQTDSGDVRLDDLFPGMERWSW
jgi:hypothetical protein